MNITELLKQKFQSAIYRVLEEYVYDEEQNTISYEFQSAIYRVLEEYSEGIITVDELLGFNPLFIAS